jgi:hypothetical protein
MGVWVPDRGQFGWKKGDHVKGEVVVGNQAYPVQVEVMHGTKGMAGLKIVHQSAELSALFNRLLEPTSFAHALVAHEKSAAIDRSVGFPRLWYFTEGAELLVWFDSKTHLLFGLQLRWVGQWVFRERRQPAQTGLLAPSQPIEAGSRARGAEIAVHHPEADTELLRRAGQFLVAVPKPLPGRLLWQFLENGQPIELPETLFSPPDKKTA